MVRGEEKIDDEAGRVIDPILKPLHRETLESTRKLGVCSAQV